MHRKHYDLIARRIRFERSVAVDLRTAAHVAAIDGLARVLSRDLQLDNPKFDRDRFLIDCQVPK